MKDINIVEYNKLCADVLNLNRDTECVVYNMRSYGYEYLKFHTDWEWIMDVVEAIKSIKEKNDFFMVTKFDITNRSVTINFEYDDVYDSIHVGHTDNGRYFKNEGDVDDQKEAIVLAIYKFLKWYKLNG